MNACAKVRRLCAVSGLPSSEISGLATTCTITLENLSFEPVTFSLRERFPAQVKLKAATVVGAIATDPKVSVALEEGRPPPGRGAFTASVDAVLESLAPLRSRR